MNLNIDLTGVLFLDTETTGLGSDDEIVQIAVLDVKGTVLLDELVKPHKPIGEDVIKIHGITDKMVAHAPTFDQVWLKLYQMIIAPAPSRIYAYNAEFDRRMILQSLRACGVDEKQVVIEMTCAMRLYAQIKGLRWAKLTDALAQCGIAQQAKHNAAVDADSVRKLMRKIAGMEQTNASHE